MQELLAVLPDWLGVYLLTVNVAAFAAVSYTHLTLPTILLV